MQKTSDDCDGSPMESQSMPRGADIVGSFLKIK